MSQFKKSNVVLVVGSVLFSTFSIASDRSSLGSENLFFEHEANIYSFIKNFNENKREIEKIRESIKKNETLLKKNETLLPEAKDISLKDFSDVLKLDKDLSALSIDELTPIRPAA